MVGFAGTVYTAEDGPLSGAIPGKLVLVSDYGEDIATALTALFNVAVGGVSGGTIRLTASATYNISAQLTITNKTDFKFDFNGATIKATAGMPSTSTSMLRVTGCSNFWIAGTGTIDGNMRGGRTRVATLGHGLMLMNVHHFSVTNMLFYDVPNCDGFILRWSDPGTYAEIPHDGLFYKCISRQSFRNGITVTGARYGDGHGIQFLGCTFEDQGQGLAAYPNPEAGIDLEPDVQGVDAVGAVGPALNGILIRGCTFQRNGGPGVSLSNFAGQVTGVTIEGCYFTDGATFKRTNVPAYGYGVNLNSDNILVQKNTFNTFSRTGSQGRSVVDFTAAGGNVGGPNSTNLIFDNTFLNISTDDPIVYVHSLSGTGNQVNDNRYSSIGSSTFLSNNDPTGCTSSNNISSSTLPAPAPPWDVTFSASGGSGGDIPAFGAKLGETIVADTTPAGTSVTVTNCVVAAGANRALVVCASFRDTGSAGQQISSVVFNGAESASELTTTTIGTNIRRNSIWGLLNPTQTTANVVVTFSTSVEAARVTVYQYNGVDSFGAAATPTTATSSSPSISLTSTRANSRVVASVQQQRSANNPSPYTPDPSDNERTDNVTGATASEDFGFTDLDTDAATIGAYTVSTAASAVTEWTMVAIELKSAVATVTVLATGLNRTTRALGAANVQVTTPSVVVVIPTGLTRATRAMGSPLIPIDQPTAVACNIFQTVIIR